MKASQTENLEKLIKFRNGFERVIYKKFLRTLLFKIDPETTHVTFVKIGQFLGKIALTRNLTSALFNYQNRILEQKILGMVFRNPIGLAAGFDKNAVLIDCMKDVGFGFVEVGSITAKAAPGNTGNRIKRLTKEKSLWINLGLNNEGADVISEKLKIKKFELPVGISVARTNNKECAEDEKGIEDYLYTIKKFKDIGDYFTINISCPNAFGGQSFARPKAFERLMKKISHLKIKKPIFVKLSPDLNRKNINEILNISYHYGIKGIICSNLTKNHKFKNGGVSGKLLEEKANQQLKYVALQNNKKNYGFIIIGVGGIFSAEDAYKKIKLGANLVQLITGMIYEGPQLISSINQGLVKLLQSDGYKNISEAVGKDLFLHKTFKQI